MCVFLLFATAVCILFLPKIGCMPRPSEVKVFWDCKENDKSVGCCKCFVLLLVGHIRIPLATSQGTESQWTLPASDAEPRNRTQATLNGGRRVLPPLSQSPFSETVKISSWNIPPFNFRLCILFIHWLTVRQSLQWPDVYTFNTVSDACFQFPSLFFIHSSIHIFQAIYSFICLWLEPPSCLVIITKRTCSVYRTNANLHYHLPSDWLTCTQWALLLACRTVPIGSTRG